MNAAKIILSFLAVTISLPIWLFLFYRVLVAINANELEWFLFFVYVPVQFICALIHVVADRVEAESGAEKVDRG